VRLAAGVDRAADLGHPQPDAEVLEDGVGEGELVAVEGALRLADHSRLEAAAWVAEGGEQLAGLGAALPWQRAGVADVEELRHDHPTPGLDQLTGTSHLPRPRRRHVLEAITTDTAIERERDHRSHMLLGVLGVLRALTLAIPPRLDLFVADRQASWWSYCLVCALEPSEFMSPRK
jgi:hypothetical protein